MVLREFNMEKYDGYETPDDDPQHSLNICFVIEGYSLQIDKGFIKYERGTGDTIAEALNNAYNKIMNRLKIRYKVTVTEMKVNEYYKLKIGDERSVGFGFFPLDFETIEKFREDEENIFMRREEKIKMH